MATTSESLEEEIPIKLGSKTSALEVLGEQDLTGKYYLITGANQGIG